MLFSGAQGADMLVSGPPCQGHSALNNHTRHDDPRNDLYLAVARAARILKPKVVVVENVSGIGRDRRRALDRCREALERDYETFEARVDLSSIGVPQRRVRHVLIATAQTFEWLRPKRCERDVGWALEDLLELEGTSEFDSPSRPTAINQRRIDSLFAHGEYNLPNPERPRCHRSEHSYLSMYGRLWWNRPAQTITSGYGSMGQGRFVHPLRPRTITPHEAARLQFIPDFMPIGRGPSRGAWARMIGNAAPPMLMVALTQSLAEAGAL